MNKIKSTKGITLISLVVTIIILLILAGVTINLTLGKNGLFKTAKEATEKYGQAGAREKLEAVLVELQADKITKQEYNEKDYINDKLEQNNMEVEGDIVTVEGWQFEIDRSVPEIAQNLGKETELKRATRGKAKFVYDTQSPNVAKVEVTIEIDASVSKYTVQYNIVEDNDDSANWLDYTVGDKIEVTKNITIYGRIIDKTTNEIGYKFSSKITTIDVLPPQIATITFDKTETDVNQIIQATVVQSDLESGIDIAKCKYIVNQSDDKIGEEHISWNTAATFTQATQTLDVTQSSRGRYYLHVLSVDIVGNKIESVSAPLRFKGVVTLVDTTNGSLYDVMTVVEGDRKAIRLATDDYGARAARVNEAVCMRDLDSLTFSYSQAGTAGNGVVGTVVFGLFEDSSLLTPIVSSSASFTWIKGGMDLGQVFRHIFPRIYIYFFQASLEELL